MAAASMTEQLITTRQDTERIMVIDLKRSLVGTEVSFEDDERQRNR